MTLRPSRPEDHVAFQMENELLRLEVGHLRAQLISAQRAADPDGALRKGKEMVVEQKRKLQKARAAGRKLRTERNRARRQLARLRQRAASAREAQEGLRWLLHRRADSNLGPLVRWREGFRNLWRKHMVSETPDA